MSVSKGSIWTPANVVTCVRVALVPVWLLCAELVGAPDGSSLSVGALLVFALYALISLTDKVDGYLARSRDEVTDFGRFLDPIADKLAVVVALCLLLERGMVPSWVLLVVVARELLVDGLRMLVASKGTVVAASGLGKAKTASTMTSICGLLLCMALPDGGLRDVLLMAFYLVLVVAVALTAWSGVDYFAKCWGIMGEDAG